MVTHSHHFPSARCQHFYIMDIDKEEKRSAISVWLSSEPFRFVLFSHFPSSSIVVFFCSSFVCLGMTVRIADDDDDCWLCAFKGSR